MKFGWPQLIYIGLMLLGEGMAIAKHGEYKKASMHNAWTSLIAYAIDIMILAWGGFFG